MKRYTLFFLCLSTLIVGCNDQQDPILSARVEYARGNLLVAYNLCSEAIHADSNDYDAYILRGKINLGMKNNEAAIADYTRAIELQPHNATGYYNRAFVYSKIGETEKGEADEEQARKRDPNAQLFSKAFADPSFISPRDNPSSVATSEEEETLDPRFGEELLEEDEPDSTDAGLLARDRFREALNNAGTLDSERKPDPPTTGPVMPGNGPMMNWPTHSVGPQAKNSPGSTPTLPGMPNTQLGPIMPGLPQPGELNKQNSTDDDKDSPQGDNGEESDEPKTKPDLPRPSASWPALPPLPGPFGGVNPGPSTGLRSGSFAPRTPNMMTGPATGSPYPMTPQPNMGPSGGTTPGQFSPNPPSTTGLRRGSPTTTTVPQGPTMYAPSTPGYGPMQRQYGSGRYTPGQYPQGQYNSRSGTSPNMGGLPGGGLPGGDQYGKRPGSGSLPGGLRQPTVPVNPYGTGNVMAPPRNQVTPQNRLQTGGTNGR